MSNPEISMDGGDNAVGKMHADLRAMTERAQSAEAEMDLARSRLTAAETALSRISGTLTDAGDVQFDMDTLPDGVAQLLRMRDVGREDLAESDQEAEMFAKIVDEVQKALDMRCVDDPDRVGCSDLYGTEPARITALRTALTAMTADRDELRLQRDYEWKRRKDQRDRAIAAEKERDAAMGQAVRTYNSGYAAGHHDTVEACYTDILPCDMGTFHKDEVAELVADLLSPAPAEPKGNCADWCALNAGHSGVCGPVEMPDIEALARERYKVHGYLSRLLVSAAPRCEPDDDLLTLCTQIDNLIAGLKPPECGTCGGSREVFYVMLRNYHILGGQEES